jgi:putative AlgH/UPF0301 family transcriptional regulator
MSLHKRHFRAIFIVIVALAAGQKLSPAITQLDGPKSNPLPQAPSPGVFLPIQSRNAKALGLGKLLVASRNLGDPNFAHTVILLVRYDAKGVLGLIINRRTDVPLSRVLENLKSAKELSDPVYVGGPVEMPAVFALFQSPAGVNGAEHVFGKVYLISEKNLFEETIASRPKPDIFHVYLGYAGWTIEQLRMEVSLGSWFIFSGDTSAVFSADPDSLWQGMIRKTGLQMAKSGDKRSTPVPAPTYFSPSFSKNKQIVSIP